MVDFAGGDIQLLADIAETLHFHYCFLTLGIGPLNGGLPDHGNRAQFQLIVHDQFRNQDGGVRGQLYIAQVPDITEVLAHRGRPVPGRVPSQDPAKYEGGPGFLGVQFPFAPQI